jgi:hypothetical protein
MKRSKLKLERVSVPETVKTTVPPTVVVKNSGTPAVAVPNPVPTAVPALAVHDRAKSAFTLSGVSAP